ncbi:type II toxin-antitoxin system VapB family antitoxin [Candidatus Magnetomonas plexicatena]|uniref:type II toxin-antitoxin system VapB family antitoxin n=1 Tax=Candidatus Magnetomonas plexicatena TaxID=2552947 RepID=UPI0011010351|nr:type II toxin-antitoxin system VapB family antitoxin [Nitrospirales bacterium LBB_01]
MCATLNISDDLIKTVQKLSGEKSKTKAITVAMEEYVRHRKIKDLLALKGKVSLAFDWEAQEEREMKTQKEREKLLENRGR